MRLKSEGSSRGSLADGTRVAIWGCGNFQFLSDNGLLRVTGGRVASFPLVEFDHESSGHRRIARANPKTPARDDNTRTARAMRCDMNGPIFNASHPLAITDSAVDPPLIVADQASAPPAVRAKVPT